MSLSTGSKFRYGNKMHSEGFPIAFLELQMHVQSHSWHVCVACCSAPAMWRVSEHLVLIHSDDIGLLYMGKETSAIRIAIVTQVILSCRN